MTHKAKKVVIITERGLVSRVAEVIERHGATGYTVVTAGGKGSRGIRAENRAKVVDALSNVKIEVITGTPEMAEGIAEEVAEKYFTDYSGITYLEDVDILRPHKFNG